MLCSDQHGLMNTSASTKNVNAKLLIAQHNAITHGDAYRTGTFALVYNLPVEIVSRTLILY